VAYASCFIGLVLVFIPRTILSGGALPPLPAPGLVGLGGMALAGLGGALALWCILTFVLLGKGTPAPFDPPRRLVLAGPYRAVRNPMYLGAAAVLSGVALVYRSWGVACYAALFLGAMHLFVVLYEEPALTHLFGPDYTAYRARVPRWLPRVPR
jgi:protein-S-isoprenylcysteine O-methyltransferase Ste14